MIQQIRIQNFRSLKDVTLDLQQVNLLIGPNNSGKTNVLRALVFLSKIFEYKKEFKIPEDEFRRNIYYGSSKDVKSITFIINFAVEEHFYFYQIEIKQRGNFEGKAGVNESGKPINEFLRPEQGDIRSLGSLISVSYAFNQFTNSLGYSTEDDHDPINVYLRSVFLNIQIYKPDPTKFNQLGVVESVTRFSTDGSNIVSFLHNLILSHRENFLELEENLRQCVGDIVSISTPPDPDQKGYMKLKFFDKNKNSYDAEDVSEGVLYFLALLCIIHQPDPPKLILLEEPERGIHPRRIREVVDFIFDLAYDKGIQVIATTHDTYVVDQFADIPEAVFVFDKKDGATEVKNLQKDIIKPADQLHTENGLPPTNYTRSLGEHWAAGFLGGVPQ